MEEEPKEKAKYYKDMTPEEKAAYDEFHNRVREEWRQRPLSERIDWVPVFVMGVVLFWIVVGVWAAFQPDSNRKRSSSGDCTWDAFVGHDCP